MKKYLIILSAAVALSGCKSGQWINQDPVTHEAASIAISKKSVGEMVVGQTKQLRAAISPVEVSDNTLEWSSSDTEVATVDMTGLVKAVGLGDATIYVSPAVNRNLIDSCTVSVTSASGIRLIDKATGDEVDGRVLFVRNSTGSRDYSLFVAVHNSLDLSVTAGSSRPESVDAVLTETDGCTGLQLIPGQELGTSTITIQSVANDDVVMSFDAVLETVAATGIKLSFDENGDAPSSELTNTVTIGNDLSVRVVFSTDKDGFSLPENNKVILSSNNENVATVDPVGVMDPSKGAVFFNIRMVEDRSIVGQSAVITAKSDDGGYTATVSVEAKCPAVTAVILSEDISDPIHAGEQYQLTARVEPEDAYVRTFVWSSGNTDVATVDQNGLVTVNPDFVFDPDNAQATEVLITAASAENNEISASCKILPYQYVKATGVMVTDQWGNRIRGTGSTATKITSPDDNYACMQYCAGSGTNKTTNLGELKSWAVASPLVAGVENVGSIAVFLTGTPYPYTYPTIADPDQPFYWACYSDSRFSVAGEGYMDGSTSKGWGGYNKDDGKKRLFLGHTCKFFTGHTSSGADVIYVRVWRYDEGVANDALTSKSLLLRFSVHTTYKANDTYGNFLTNLKNSDGTAKVFAPISPEGISKPYADPCPNPWTGPMPRPVGYYLLDADGNPASLESYGGIPVPSELTEYPY